MNRFNEGRPVTTSILLAAAAVAVATAGTSGCTHDAKATTAAVQAPPQVTVAQVLSRQMTDFDEFTGHFEAVERVEIRPRVSGYISSVNFTQGREVKKGDVLFVIDPRPYEAELKKVKAELAQARSQLALSKSERDRAVKLLDSHAISREEYDTRVAGTEQSTANVDAAEAAVDSAALNLTFTRVTAPISGVVGRAEITEGNLVSAGQTLLTTLVSQDPIYVSFEGDEQGYLRYMELARNAGRDARHPVWVGLANEQGYPHEGAIVFVNNEIDAATGTARARGLLENHDRRFTPGMFARVKLPGSSTYRALLINDSSVGTDQSVKYVLRVGKDNRVEYQPVKLGPVVDGLRVVRSGLKDGDVIVVNGLQRVRPGAPVTPQRVAMGERHINDAQPDRGESQDNMLARNAH
jgi:RND family efflux transporter MFP subunit